MLVVCLYYCIVAHLFWLGKNVCPELLTLVILWIVKFTLKILVWTYSGIVPCLVLRNTVAGS